jgi:hypothetical protein
MPWDQGNWDSSSWDTEIITSVITSKKKPHMTRQAFYPIRVADQILWLGNLSNKFTGHAPVLGVTVAKCEAAIADARWLIYILGSWLPAVRAWQKACTIATELAQSGEGTATFVLPLFVPPALPGAAGGLPAVIARPPGALDRIFDIISEIKESDTYTDAIGLDLGVIGSGKTPPDLASIQPVLKVRTVGNKVQIDWGWAGNSAFLDQLEIQVDRGSGYEVLTFDTTPGYTDSAAFPATPTKWKYRAIYRLDDQQVGQWSAEASVTVG